MICRYAVRCVSALPISPVPARSCRTASNPIQTGRQLLAILLARLWSATHLAEVSCYRSFGTALSREPRLRVRGSAAGRFLRHCLHYHVRQRAARQVSCVGASRATLRRLIALLVDGFGSVTPPLLCAEGSPGCGTIVTLRSFSFLKSRLCSACDSSLTSCRSRFISPSRLTILAQTALIFRLMTIPDSAMVKLIK